MGTIFVYALLIALILPVAAMLAAEDRPGRSDYRGATAVALALGALFFALTFLQPNDAPDAWAFRAFYGVLCVLTVVGANLLVCLERSHA